MRQSYAAPRAQHVRSWHSRTRDVTDSAARARSVPPSSIALSTSDCLAFRLGSESYLAVTATYTSSPQYASKGMPAGGSRANPRCSKPTTTSATWAPESSM